MPFSSSLSLGVLRTNYETTNAYGVKSWGIMEGIIKWSSIPNQCTVLIPDTLTCNKWLFLDLLSEVEKSARVGCLTPELF